MKRTLPLYRTAVSLAAALATCHAMAQQLSPRERVLLDAANELSFAVSGDAATLVALDNGDATNHEAFQGTAHKAFHGLALAILKSHGGATGDVTLKITGDGLEPATMTVHVTPGGKTWRVM
jgi:hypothetical protein